MTIIGVIPARYSSHRFPGKPLADLEGKPLVQHVYERACSSKSLKRVIVATDDGRIYKAVRAFGGEVTMTSTDHKSGSDRVAEVARKIDADIIVNIQGDEPLLDPLAIDQAVTPLWEDATLSLVTLAHPITDPKDLLDPNVVKVAVDLKGWALYFSRSPIPSPLSLLPPPQAQRRARNRKASPGVGISARESLKDLDARALVEGKHWLRHIGLYAFRRQFLVRFAGLDPSPLEKIERLEQLRALEHGFRIRIVVTAYDSVGVDIPEDLARVRERLRQQSSETRAAFAAQE
jgi:3-deoxy-manno-octulosonate cytidylyltransferase (CMP-KDO synthetase)